MEIDPATQGDAGIYECHANNKWVNGLDSEVLTGPQTKYIDLISTCQE